MGKRFGVVFALVLMSGLLAGFVYIRSRFQSSSLQDESISGSEQDASLLATASSSPQPSPSPVPSPADVSFSASFEIYTKGTKRIFTDPRYHQKNEVVFINADASNQVNVRKAGVTWNDFFATLPMSLSADCLVTGTKQTFCTGDEGTLRFWINGEENPRALEQTIQPDDVLVVRFE